MDDCDIFRDQLATTYPRYGYALWNPSPVEVGDVGFIRWGTFHRLFNALRPANDPSHELGLPTGYKPLALGVPNHINRLLLRRGHYCSNGICVESVPGYQDGPDDFPKLSFLLPGKQKGAVLFLPVDARRENTIAPGYFGKWMIENIDRLFNFARRFGLGIEQMEQIILVTGCDRATSWINVAFLGNHDNARVSFGVETVDPDGPNTRIKFQFPPGNVQGAVLNYGPQGTGLLDSQCVFIRGFRVARTLRIWPKHLKAAADSTRDPEGDGGDLDKELVSIPADTEYQDPLQLLLSYTVEKATDCDMVLIHDDDLQKIVRIESDAETVKNQPTTSAFARSTSSSCWQSLDIPLQPAIMMDLIRRSNIDIHKVSYAVSTSTTGPETDIVVGRVAKISVIPQSPRNSSNVASGLPGPSLSRTHPSRDGPGACYPPPTYPFAAPAYGPAPASGGYMAHTSKLSIPGFKMNQTVSARTTTDTWVMGVIIGIAHVCSKIIGRTYVVEFESVDGRRERREFSNEELRPYQPGG